MRRYQTSFAVTIAGLVALFIAGCGSAGSEPAGDASSSALPPDTVELGQEDHGHDHGHLSEGPHHGRHIKLGGGKYHAELVDDEETDTITVYVLDGVTNEPVPIEATEITINVKHDGKGVQYSLAASPEKGEPEGMSSRFVSNDKELGADLDGEDAEAQLVLKIDSKSFRGKIEHDHGHGHEHNHAH